MPRQASGLRITRKDTRVLERMIRETPDKLDRAGRAIAQEIVNDIVESFGTSPSSPGDPPGVDTGALRASMRWSPGGKFKYFVHDGVVYGVYLEFGTERMAPRPFINPVFEEWSQRKFSTALRRLAF